MVARDGADIRAYVTCPEGHAVRGTSERLWGVMPLGPTGAWGNEGTEVCWDSAETEAEENGLPTLVCTDGCTFSDARMTWDVINGCESAKGVCIVGNPTIEGFPCGDPACLCAPQPAPLAPHAFVPGPGDACARTGCGDWRNTENHAAPAPDGAP